MAALQDVVIDAVHDGGIDVLAAGRGDDDFLGAALEVRRGLLLAGEEAGALEHDVHARALSTAAAPDRAAPAP